MSRIKERAKRKNKKVGDLNITSLLDVIVILLVFLIQNYDSSDVVFTLPQEVKVPISQKNDIASRGISVMVSPNQIWLDDVVIMSNQNLPQKIYDEGGKRIVPLYDALVSRKNKIDIIAKSTNNATSFSGDINLIIDKSIKYSYIKKILFTCAQAGFDRYRLVLREK